MSLLMLLPDIAEDTLNNRASSLHLYIPHLENYCVKDIVICLKSLLYLVLEKTAVEDWY